MDDSGKMSLEQIRAFLAASEPVAFAGQSREEVYNWVEQTLREHDYQQRGRADKGLLRRYLGKMTGLSRAQVTRLIASYWTKGASRSNPTSGTGSPPATPPPMWSYWPTSTECTRR